MIVTRRRFLGGLSALIAAPAIVRASSLMAVREPRIIPAKFPFYANKTIRTYMDIDKIRNRNVLLLAQDLFEPYAMRGIPILVEA